ncbi:MAG: LysE family transporter [Anaerolineae bacterium]|nr:LysE family transporter [Anaerolineae bacterium]
MNIGLLFRGLIIGLSIAAPVGPIGVLCIRRTLAQGRAVGLVSGLGAATADALFGCIAGLGLTVVSDVLVEQQVWLSLLGGLFLCYLGVKTLLSQSAEEAASLSIEGTGLLRAYTSTLFLTLTNPMSILAFAAIYTGLGAATGDYGAALALVSGVFIGSALWWLMLSGGVSLFRDKFNTRSLLWVNRLSGVVILGFGIVPLFGFAVLLLL